MEAFLTILLLILPIILGISYYAWKEYHSSGSNLPVNKLDKIDYSPIDAIEKDQGSEEIMKDASPQDHNNKFYPGTGPLTEYTPLQDDKKFQSVIAGDTHGIVMTIFNGVLAGVIGGIGCAWFGAGKLTFPIYLVISFLARAGLKGSRANIAFVISMVVAVITNGVFTSLNN
jgi:hypothetical protein